MALHDKLRDFEETLGFDDFSPIFIYRPRKRWSRNFPRNQRSDGTFLQRNERMQRVGGPIIIG